MKSIEDQSNALVVYRPGELEISKAVLKVTPLREIQPENIVVTNEGLYRAKAVNLQPDEHGLRGFLFLAFYREINQPSENKTPSSLSEMIIRKFLGESREKPDIVHDDHEYQLAWRLWSSSGSYHDRLIWRGHWGDRIHEEGLANMKSQLLQKHDLLFSNDFLSTLYSPILRALLALSAEIARY